MFYHFLMRPVLKHNHRHFKTFKSAYEYLDDNVFCKEEFKEHVNKSAKENDISYIVAYDVITNHLTDIFYEIEKAIVKPEVKLKIRIYQYFSLHIGFMISSNKSIKELIKYNRNNTNVFRKETNKKFKRYERRFK